MKSQEDGSLGKNTCLRAWFNFQSHGKKREVTMTERPRLNQTRLEKENVNGGLFNNILLYS